MNEINYDEVRKRLEYARKNKEISLDEIGKMLGVHKSTISRWEKGKTEKIQLPVFEKLAEIYNVNVMWLMGYDVPMKRTNDNLRNKSNSDFRYASYQGLDLEGLDEKDIEELNQFVEFIKNKKKNKSDYKE